MAVSWPLASAVTWFQNIFQTAATMQANITDPLNDLNSRTAVPVAPPIAKLYNSGAQSIPNATSTALTWDSEVVDTVGGHSTSSNTSRYTCQTGYAGWYRVDATAAFSGNATGIRRIQFFVNGTLVPASAGNLPASSNDSTVSSETLVFLNAGDYVEAEAFQTSGGALSLRLDVGTFQSWLDVQWVHP